MVSNINFSDFMNKAMDSMRYRAEEEQWFVTTCPCGFALMSKDTKEKCPNCGKELKWEKSNG